MLNSKEKKRFDSQYVYAFNVETQGVSDREAELTRRFGIQAVMTVDPEAEGSLDKKMMTRSG